MPGNYVSVSKTLFMNINRKHTLLLKHMYLDLILPPYSTSRSYFPSLYFSTLHFGHFFDFIFQFTISLFISFNFWLNYQRFFFLSLIIFLFYRHSVLFFKFACLLLGFSSVSFFNTKPTCICIRYMAVLISELLMGLHLPFLVPTQKDYFLLGLYLWDYSEAWVEVTPERTCFLLTALLGCHQPRRTVNYLPKCFQSTLGHIFKSKSCISVIL